MAINKQFDSLRLDSKLIRYSRFLVVVTSLYAGRKRLFHVIFYILLILCIKSNSCNGIFFAIQLNLYQVEISVGLGNYTQIICPSRYSCFSPGTPASSTTKTGC